MSIKLKCFEAHKARFMARAQWAASSNTKQNSQTQKPSVEMPKLGFPERRAAALTTTLRRLSTHHLLPILSRSVRAAMSHTRADTSIMSCWVGGMQTVLIFTAAVL